MKNTGFYFITSAFVLCSALGIATNVYAATEVNPAMDYEQQSYKQNIEPDYTRINYQKIAERKNSILQKIAQIKNDAESTSSVKIKENSILGDTPRVLYSYSRLLDYSPHPRTESILEDKPVLFGGRNYHFTVTYREEWKEVSANLNALIGLCFTVDVYENGKIVRNLTTPRIAIDPKKLKKDQIIGIAEVAPFKFNIKVDNVVSTSNVVTELTFKLDLIG